MPIRKYGSTQESTRRGLAVLIGVFTVGFTATVASVGWLGEQIALVSNIELRIWVSPAIAIVPAVVTRAAALVTAALIRMPWLRGTLRLWAYAAGCAALLGLTTFIPGDRDIVQRNSLALGATILIVRREVRVRWIQSVGQQDSKVAHGVGVAGSSGLFVPASGVDQRASRSRGWRGRWRGWAVACQHGPSRSPSARSRVAAAEGHWAS
jgi:hypothetical protein